MDSRTTRYYYTGMCLCILSIILVSLSLAQEFGLIDAFDDPPLLPGAGIGAIGVSLMWGAKNGKQAEAEEKNS